MISETTSKIVRARHHPETNSASDSRRERLHLTRTNIVLCCGRVETCIVKKSQNCLLTSSYEKRG